MENNFIHNFCESRLTNNQPPEIYNSYTSLCITFFPLLLGFPRNTVFYNVACMLAFNGVASFYYHYRLDWIGKQADEISMILANYYGIWGLLQMYYIHNKLLLNWYNGWNTMFMIMFLTSNTISSNDVLFPILFSFYMGVTLFLIDNVSAKYGYPYKYHIIVSGIGAKCWIISEVWCNEYTQYGHVLWHLLFPLGFYSLVLQFDREFRTLKYNHSF